MTQMASVYLRNGQLILCSDSRTQAGFWVMNGRCEILPESVTDERLGAAVDGTLADSEDGVPVPPRDSGSILEPVLAELGVRSWAAFAKGARLVEISRDGGVVAVTPTRNRGTREGFVEIDDDVASLDSPRDAALGSAVRAGLARSR